MEAVRGFGGIRTVNEIDQGMFDFGYGDPLAVMLNHTRGGSTRMVLVLGAFIVGSYVGTWHFVWWQERPKLDAVSLYRDFGWAGGVALQLAIFAVLYGVTLWLERRRHLGGRPRADRLIRALRQ